MKGRSCFHLLNSISSTWALYPSSFGLLLRFYSFAWGLSVLFHNFWMLCPRGALLRWLAVKLGVQVVATLPRRFLLFDWNPMSIRPDVLSNSGYHPGHFHLGIATRNFEAVLGNLFCDVDGRESSDARQLITELLVEGSEPSRKLHYGFTLCIQVHDPVVDVLHVR